MNSLRKTEDISTNTFGGTWPYKPNFIEVNDAKLHYIQEGHGQETLLLIHGEPTWSYLYRTQIKHWSKNHHVIALDHLGFGKSEKPTDRTYWLQDHVDNLEKFILKLDLNNITLIMHDFGGPTGMSLATRLPDRIKSFVFINAPAPANQTELQPALQSNFGKSQWFQWIATAHENNKLRNTLKQLKYNMLSTLYLNGFENKSIITDHWLEAYSTPFFDEDETLGPIGWAEGIAKNEHHFPIPSPTIKEKLHLKPALTIWGKQDKTLHADEFIPLFEDFFLNGQSRILDNAGHYSLEDAPNQIIEIVEQFISLHK